MDTRPIGFTIGDLGTVRDRQSAPVSPDTVALAGTTTARLESPPEHCVGEYVADYSPLAAGDLADPAVDAELEALLRESTIVRRGEGA